MLKSGPPISSTEWKKYVKMNSSIKGNDFQQPQKRACSKMYANPATGFSSSITTEHLPDLKITRNMQNLIKICITCWMNWLEILKTGWYSLAGATEKLSKNGLATGTTHSLLSTEFGLNLQAAN